MLIQCPRCSTGWRVAETPPTENPIFKCGRCHHLFRRFPGAPQDNDRRSTSPKRQSRPPASDNLEFIFPERSRPSEAPDPAGERAGANGVELDDDDTVVAREQAFDGDGDRVAAAPELDDDDALIGEPDDDALVTEPDCTDDDTITADPDLDEAAEPYTISAGTYPETRRNSDSDWNRELDALAPAHTSRVLHVEDIMSRSYGFGTIARSLIAIIALHALLALSIRLAPERAGALLSRIPLADTLLEHETTLTQRVELRNVAGAFQRLRNKRRVFVITGEAVNHSATSIERIQVEGALYGSNGRIDQKIVSAGNRTILRDLSESEIALLQRLDPRRIVEPGESSAFLIVFLEPPRTVREFSSRVLNVRRTRRLVTESPMRSGPGSVG